MAQGPYLPTISSSGSPLHPLSDTKRTKQEWPSSLRWSVVKDGSVFVHISLGSKFKFVHFMRRNIFWDPNFIVGREYLAHGQSGLSSSPLLPGPSYKLRVKLDIVILYFSYFAVQAGIWRVTETRPNEFLGNISRYVWEPCQYSLVIPVACVPQPQTQPLPRCITVHGNGRKPSIW